MVLHVLVVLVVVMQIFITLTTAKLTTCGAARVRTLRSGDQRRICWSACSMSSITCHRHRCVRVGATGMSLQMRARVCVCVPVCLRVRARALCNVIHHLSPTQVRVCRGNWYELADARACVCMCLCACVCVRVQVCVLVYLCACALLDEPCYMMTRSHTHTLSHAHAHTHIHTRALTHIHALTHTHTHTRTHTHANTQTHRWRPC